LQARVVTPAEDIPAGNNTAEDSGAALDGLECVPAEHRDRRELTALGWIVVSQSASGAASPAEGDLIGGDAARTKIPRRNGYELQVANADHT
jgi:hypothetical protein